MNKCVDNIISILAKLNSIPLNCLVIVIAGELINYTVAIPYNIKLNKIVNTMTDDPFKRIIINITS